MSTTALAASIQVNAIWDSQGNPISVAQPFSLQYSSAGQFYLVSPTSAWPHGNYFSILVATTAYDINGLPLIAQTTYYYNTVRDHTAPNVAIALGEPATRVMVPENAFSADYFLVISTGIAGHNLLAANDNMKATLGSDHAVLKTVEIDPFNAQGGAWTSLLNQNVTLMLPFSQADGIVTGTKPPIKASSLTVWRLENDRPLWVKQAAGSIDLVDNALLLPTAHFSIYGIVGQQNNDVNDVYAFPVPFRPNAGNTARYGSWAAGITFTNLPAAGLIRVYTVSGSLVRELSITGNPQTWDVTNSGGQQVASGLYIWEVKATVTGNRKTGKLVIVR